MITDKLIFKESGQYDKEVIQHLILESFNIKKISNLDMCSNLMELSLAHNDISFISGLDNLVNLRILNISFNKINKIEKISNLINLESFDIRGNNVENINDINEFKMLENLKTIYFKGTNGEDANPICKHPAYIDIILRDLPQLDILDGGHIRINQAFNTIEEEIEKLKPDPSLCKTPPIESWIDSGLSNNSEDIEAIINQSKFYVRVNKEFEEINQRISEECGHLLRKSQSLINKSNQS